LDAARLYGLAADAVLTIHVAIVVFVVAGLAAILVGGRRRWAWVHRPGFRIFHAVAIGVVALQAWAGVICPLTTWEMALREKAGDAVYEGSFIAHWLGALLYYEAPAWVFTTAYTAFALAVGAAFVFVPVRRTPPHRRS